MLRIGRAIFTFAKKFPKSAALAEANVAAGSILLKEGEHTPLPYFLHLYYDSKRSQKHFPNMATKIWSF